MGAKREGRRVSTLEWIASHWLAASGYVALLTTSAVKTLPLPGQPFSVYTFFYDWSHQFFNITNTRLSTEPVKTPPEAAPNPTKAGV